MTSGPFDNTNYTIKFNAPALGEGSGADTDIVPGADYPNQPGGLRLPDPNLRDLKVPRKDILMRKAWFMPDTTYSADWEDNSDDEADTEVSEEDTTSVWDDVWPDSWPWSNEGASIKDTRPKNGVNAANLFTERTKYGFRFMYNPSVLTFSLGLSTNVNSSYMFSGAATALPSGLSSSGSTIGVSFPISRVDDLSVIAAITGKSAWNLVNSTPTILSEFTTDELRRMYGSGDSFPKIAIPRVDASMVDTTVRMSDIRSIAARGTMYDLDFLFRTCIGRQWKTYYRGYTSDTGIAWSQPLILFLNAAMIYRVRLTEIRYTHKMFTPDMIPTYTEVTLGFERIPDVVGYSPAPQPNEGSGETQKPSGEIASQ